MLKNTVKNGAKKLLSFALALLMLLSLMPMSALADGATSGSTTRDGVTYTLENGVLTISGKGESSYLWKDYFNKRAVNKAIIKDGITCIGDSTFYECVGLSSVTIPNGVTVIDYAAFDGCSGLKSIAIPDSVTSVGAYAFKNCIGLKSVVIPDSVTSVGAEAFRDCTGLTEVKIGNGVTNICRQAFEGCTGLTSITVPNNVISIQESAFSKCTGLKEAIIPSSVTYIGDYAFYECKGLRSVTLGCNLSEIGMYAFNKCNAIADVYYFGTKDQWNAITISLGNEAIQNAAKHFHTHSYTDVVTKPTCTEMGYTTHTCACGESYKDSYVDALGHKYENGKCIRCGEADPNADKPSENPFTDVTSEKYFYAPVMWAVNHDPQITGGYTDGTFRPQNTCTRAQIVTFIWRAAGKPAAPAGTVNTFTDVSATSYYYEAVMWAVANGITGGYNAYTFGSNDGCTRGQIVTFLYRNMK